MAKTIATLLGAVLLLVGIVGFVSPNFLGAHLNVVHNCVHIVTGALSLYFGLAGTLAAARAFDLAFGAVYALLGVAGFIAGTGDDRMLNLGGLLHLGMRDHAIHILLGVVYLIGGLLTKAVVANNGRDRAAG
jgi:hypothetical protein